MKNKKMYYWKIRKWREELLKKVLKKLDKKRKSKLNLNKLRDKLHSKAKMLKLHRIKSNLQKLHHLVEVYHQKHLNLKPHNLFAPIFLNICISDYLSHQK